MRNYKTAQLLGIILILCGTIGFAALLLTFRPTQVDVLVPTHNIGPYQPLNLKQDFKSVTVRAAKVKTMDGHELTTKWLAKEIKNAPDGIIFNTTAILKDQRVDNRVIDYNRKGSFSVLAADERPVTVTVTLAGSVGGIIQPGNVVSLSTDDGDVNIPFAKVLRFGSAAAIAGGDATDSNQGGGLYALVGVPKDQADVLSGKSVTMVLNPNCEVSDAGKIEPVAKDDSASECETSSTSSSSSDSNQSDNSTVDTSTDGQ